MPEKFSTESMRLDKLTDYYDQVGVNQFELMSKDLDEFKKVIDDLAIEPKKVDDDDDMACALFEGMVAVWHRLQMIRRSVGIDGGIWSQFQAFDMGHQEFLMQRDQKRRARDMSWRQRFGAQPPASSVSTAQGVSQAAPSQAGNAPSA